MADERYEWLDQDTAERLLRGEPVEALDEPARTEAVRLDRALRAAVPVAPSSGQPAEPSGELPGEAAALAAFRAARTPPGAKEDGGLGVVHIGTAPRSRRRRTRLSSPFRFGVVAAVAGFAFGGVAVASGGDLLPSPFGNASSSGGNVTAGATSDSLVDRSSDKHSGSPSGAPHRPPGTTGAQSGAPTSPGDGLSADGKRTDRAAELHLKVLNACSRHRAGTIDAKGRKLLAATAKGRDRVDAYCAARLAEAPGAHPGVGNGNGRGRPGATAPTTPGGPGAGTASGKPNRGTGEQSDRGKGNGKGNGNKKKDKKKGEKGKPDRGGKGDGGERAGHGSRGRDDRPRGHHHDHGRDHERDRDRDGDRGRDRDQGRGSDHRLAPPR
ncbi:hypothetical protein [Streptomyces sp. NPDC047315]|uniref:hypothetical protein n=1 Tax=Streptomyces sp. NPDC047315 TaxID=3155142 RepID=UPI0034044CB4